MQIMKISNKKEDNLEELIFSFYYGDLGGQTVFWCEVSLST